MGEIEELMNELQRLYRLKEEGKELDRLIEETRHKLREAIEREANEGGEEKDG